MAPAWDFFVSYTQKDRAWAEWIAFELEERGYRVLIQAWDMVPGSNWAHTMQQGVQGATRTIAVMSPDYLTSAYCTVEWEQAWADDPLGQERKLIPVRVRECDRPGLLGHIVSVDLIGLPETTARLLLLDTVAGVVSGRLKPASRPAFPRTVPDVVPFPGALPAVWSVPARNPHFTGRERELDLLHRELAEGATVAVHSLRGMGGVGKSQLAIEYAYRHADAYDIVWWFAAEQAATIGLQFPPLAEALGLPVDGDVPSIVERTRQALRRTPDWLLIFDNAETVEPVRELLPGGAGQVIVTTRRAGFGAVGRVLDVNVLDRAESVELLRQRLPDLGDELADGLADLLGDLPLALAQAASYVEQTGLPVADYLELVRTRLPAMVGRGELADHKQTLATLWELSYEWLGRERPAAIQLLRLCARLAPEDIPLALFTEQAALLPEPLATAAADPVACADTVGALVDHSLVRRDGGVLSLHRLVQVTARQHEDAAGDPDSTTTAVLTALANHLPGDILDTPASWPLWREMLPHVLAAVGQAGTTHGTAAEARLWLVDRAGTYLQTAGQLAAAEEMLRAAVPFAEQVYGAEHDQYAATLTSLGLVLSDLGQVDEAEPLLRRALEIEEVNREPSDPLIATAASNLGLALRDLGRFAEAEVLLRRTVALDEANHGLEHPTVATGLSNLAMVLDDLGQFEDAERLSRQALAIRERTLGTEHPAVATVLSNLALVLWNRGRAAEAEPLLSRALAINEAAYAPDHPFVAALIGNLATVTWKLGRAAEAEALLERSLAMREAAYGPDGPAVAMDLTNLALVMWDSGRFVEARSLLSRALEINEKAYGAEHPTVANSLGGLAMVTRELGHFAEAERLARRAVAIEEALRPPDHVALAMPLSNHALVLRDLQRFDEAETLLRRAVALAEGHYGPEHPDAATFLLNLGMVARDLGQTDEAETLLRRAGAILEHAFGPDHRSVANALGNLAIVLRDQDRSAEAEPLLRRTLAIGETTFAGNHQWLTIHLGTLASVLMDLGRDDEAEPVLRRAVDVGAAYLGADHPTLASPLHRLSGLCWRQGRGEEAVALMARTVAISEAGFGVDDSRTEARRADLATMRRLLAP